MPSDCRAQVVEPLCPYVHPRLNPSPLCDLLTELELDGQYDDENFQAEYGITRAEFLENHEDLVRQRVDAWWLRQTRSYKREVLTADMFQAVSRTQFLLDQLYRNDALERQEKADGQ